MNKELIKAYEEIEMLHSLELPVPEDKKKELSRMEESFVKKELFPFIQNMLKPVLENYQGNLSLSISYDKETGVQVSKLLPIAAPDSAANSKPVVLDIPKDGLYSIKSGVVEAYAEINNNVVTVLKGSKVITECKSSLRNPELRNAKLQKISKNCGPYCILEEDISFTSVSTAAVFCLGRSANGWLEWRDKNGNYVER